MTKFFRFIFPVIVWALVMFTFSSKPTGAASVVHWQDFAIKKAAHMFEYAVFVILNFRAYLNYGVEKKKALKIALLTAILYGISDEFHQSFTPGREPALRDVIFDTIGASIAVYFIWKLLPKAPLKLRELAKEFQLA